MDIILEAFVLSRELTENEGNTECSGAFLVCLPVLPVNQVKFLLPPTAQKEAPRQRERVQNGSVTSYLSKLFHSACGVPIKT